MAPTWQSSTRRHWTGLLLGLCITGTSLLGEVSAACGAGEEIFERTILSGATYSGQDQNTYTQFENTGTFQGIKVLHNSGYISAAQVAACPDKPWQCYLPETSEPAFEMDVANVGIFRMEYWPEIAAGCTGNLASSSLQCNGVFNLNQGTSLTLGWYESRLKWAYTDNHGTINVDIVGLRCEHVPTCFDNIKNQGEEDVDCGGPCDSCETCMDEIQNQGEFGIDFGGPCTSPCPCDEDANDVCNYLAFCAKAGSIITIPAGANIVPAGVSYPGGSDGKFTCDCASEQLGHGYGAQGCSTKGWNVRVVYKNRISSLSQTEENNLLQLLGVTCTRGSTIGCDHVHYTIHQGFVPNHLGANVLFPDTPAGKAAAEAAANAFNGAAPDRRSGVYPSDVDASVGARVYSWVAGTTADPLSVLPAGMEVTAVSFETGCAETGCWVIDVDFTVGHSDGQVEGMRKGYNTFYLPYAVGSDELSYDYSYGSSVMSSFQPANFPCTSGGTDLCCFGTAFGGATSCYVTPLGPVPPLGPVTASI